MNVISLPDRFLKPANPAQRQYRSSPRPLRRPLLARRGRHTLRLLARLLPQSLCRLPAPSRPPFLPPSPRSAKPSLASDSRAVRSQRSLQLRSSRQLSAYQIAAELNREGLSASVSSISATLRHAGLPRLRRRPASRILEAARPRSKLPAPAGTPSISPRAPSAPPSAASSSSLPLLAQIRFDELVAPLRPAR